MFMIIFTIQGTNNIKSTYVIYFLICVNVTGPKRDEVPREWRKLHNEELNDLYSLPNIVRVVK
jgi:hypothetical protein